MKSIIITVVTTGFFLCTSLYAQEIKNNLSNETKNFRKMNEYILYVRLPLTYGSEEAKSVRGKWDLILQKWKEDSIFVTSYIAPNEGYVLSGKERTTRKEFVVSDNLRMVSTIILKAVSLEEAMNLAKECPILEQGGTVEVREVNPRPIPNAR